MKKFLLCLALFWSLQINTVMAIASSIAQNQHLLVGDIIEETSSANLVRGKADHFVTKAQTAEQELIQAQNLTVETELALIVALPNKKAQNILLSRNSLSLSAELALVNLLNGHKMDLAKKILQNVGQKRAFYLQTQIALLEKLSNPASSKKPTSF